jgi:hypothetical protein
LLLQFRDKPYFSPFKTSVSQKVKLFDPSCSVIPENELISQ